MRFLPEAQGENIVSIKDRVLFSVHFDEGLPQFSFEMRDHSDNLTLSMERNTLVIKKLLWDVELSGQYLRVLYKKRHIALESDSKVAGRA